MLTLLGNNALWRPPGLSRVFTSGVGILVLVLVCTACAPPSTTVSGRAPQPLAGSAWEQIALPTPATDVLGITVSPTDPATIFACTAHLPRTEQPGGVVAQSLTLWRTSDTGAHWTRYEPALATGTACSFSIAPDDSQRIGLQVVRATSDGQACAQDTFYLTSIGGATWRQLPPHASIAPAHGAAWCELKVTRAHLYLASSFMLSPQAPQVTVLERSDDSGRTWSRADHGLGDNVLFSMPVVGPGDTLAVTVTRMSPPMSTVTVPTTLWLSTDAGNTWRQASTLLEGAGTFLLTSQQSTGTAETTGTRGSTWPTPRHPFYALEHEQVPSNLYLERVLMSADGRAWTPLPPVPTPGVSLDRPGVLQALDVLPDGRLAVWGADPQQGIPAQGVPVIGRIFDEFPAFWLWLWDPTSSRWQVVSSPLPTPATEGCGLCWQAQTTLGDDGVSYMYAARFSVGLPDTSMPGVFRMRLPSLSAAR